MANYMQVIRQLFADQYGNARWADGQLVAVGKNTVSQSCIVGNEGTKRWTQSGAGVASYEETCLKTAADVYAWGVTATLNDVAASPRHLIVQFQSIGLIVGSVANLIWSNMPAAETGFLGYGISDWQRWVDLRDFTEVRFVVTSALGVAGSKLRLAYSTDGAVWVTVADCLIETGGSAAPTKSGAFATLAVGARIEDCYLRVTGLDGNAVADPLFTYVAAEFK